MSDKHISGFKYRDFFKEEYEDGEEGAKELLKDSKLLIRYIFQNDPSSADKMLDDIWDIAGGDTKKQLQLLNTFFLMASPIIVENGEERHMNREELEASYPLRNMAMNAVRLVIDMTAKRIRKMQSTIDNLTEALAISKKGDVDEQSDT